MRPRRRTGRKENTSSCRSRAAPCEPRRAGRPAIATSYFSPALRKSVSQSLFTAASLFIPAITKSGLLRMNSTASARASVSRPSSVYATRRCSGFGVQATPVSCPGPAIRSMCQFRLSIVRPHRSIRRPERPFTGRQARPRSDRGARARNGCRLDAKSATTP
jgi:hypothetical protein